MSLLWAYEMNIIIYTQADCPYCEMAKHVFEQRGWSYTAYSINEGLLAKNNMESLMERFPTAKTVPQIWINDVHIGGYAELKTWLTTYLDV